MATTPASLTRYKLIFFVPVPAAEACKAAIFAAGAGHYGGPGKYTECCFTSVGTGQFRPGAAAHPNIGERGVFEEVQEARVETVCFGEEQVRKVVEALKRYVEELSYGATLLEMHQAYCLKTKYE